MQMVWRPRVGIWVRVREMGSIGNGAFARGGMGAAFEFGNMLQEVSFCFIRGGRESKQARRLRGGTTKTGRTCAAAERDKRNMRDPLEDWAARIVPERKS